MRKYFLIIVMLLGAGFAVLAQSVKNFRYSYDDNGNRVKRECISNFITGKISYLNAAASPLPYIKIEYDNGEEEKPYIVSDEQGEYSLGFEKKEDYTNLLFTSNVKYGGITPIDALCINKNFLGLYPITDALKRMVADVDTNGAIDPLDAFMINARYLKLLSSFKVSDWCYSYTKDGVVHTFRDKLENIGSLAASENLDFKVLCTGDVNGSYEPPFIYSESKKTTMSGSRSSELAKNSLIINNKNMTLYSENNEYLIELDSIKAQPGTEVVFHLKVSGFENIGALGLRIQYDTTVLGYKGIETIHSDISTMLSNNISDSLNIAWSCASDPAYPGDTVLFDIRFDYYGGESGLVFMPASIVADNAFNELEIIYTNGYISEGTPPELSLQPADTTACAGVAASFRVSATGDDPLSYQWYKIVDGQQSAVEGAIDSTFAIQNSALTDAGDYYCIVSNSLGSDTSRAANLTILTSPFITLQPVSDTICEGSEVSFSVSASGAQPLSFQWYKDDYLLDGATDSTLSIENTALADEGYYSCKIMNTCGYGYSDTSYLKVKSPANVLSALADDNICTGAFYTYEAEAEGTEPIYYRWFLNDKLLNGATNDSYTIKDAGFDNIGEYFYIASNDCGSDTSVVSRLEITNPGSYVDWETYIDAAAVVDSTAVIGIGSYINQDANIGANVRTGESVYIGTGCIIEEDVILG
ncbi:MAG: immunoglobulin domain-containing protein, partial [Bacteroidales bacterium]|nr:immunoglobulin domain-containing protein [Bacteroidales bacterium]